MKSLFLILFLIVCSGFETTAQIGIGGAPSSNSILDLSYSNDKYLILPKATTNPFTLLNDTASVIYYKDNIYMKTSQGFKVFTPWKWDGDSTHSISSPSTSTVGIGVEPPAGAQYLLQIANADDDVTDTTNVASIIIGRKDSCHILIDNDEIMAKTNQNNAGTLKFQEEDGTVTIRSSTSNAGHNTALTTYGSIDAKGKIKENNNELLPVGIIIIWSGTTVPAGWALCDGGTYAKLDGSGPITTPNLIDRFIVGADIGGNGTNGTYSINTAGGNNTNTHTHSLDPPVFTTNDGDHTHSHTTATPLIACDFCFMDIFGSTYSMSDDTHSHTVTTGTSAHSHSFNLLPFNSAAPSATDNRPPYYALAFIMKL